MRTLAIAVALSLSPALQGQEPQEKHKPEAIPQTFAKLADGYKNRIIDSKKEIPLKILDADRTAVLKAIPKVQSLFLGPVSSPDESMAVACLAYWERLRTGPNPLPADKALSDEAFVKLAAGNGQIWVASVPDQADIKVDKTYTHPRPTNTRILEKPGEHLIEVSKKGFKTASMTVTVVKAKLAKFEPILVKE